MRDLLPALRRLKVETGSLACLGCGHEHNCDLHGCAILRAAIEAIETRPEVVRCRECRFNPKYEWTGCPKAGCWREFNYDGFCSDGQRREDGDGDGNADSM